MGYKRTARSDRDDSLKSILFRADQHNKSIALFNFIPEMQFSVVALSLASVSAVLAADAISQIGDGQIQATTSTGTPAATSTVPTTAPTSTEEVPQTQTENGANQIVGGAAMAGLVAAGALLI